MREEIINFFDELFPDAHCELDYNNDFELLINIALSAQTTDKKVNQISKDLFFLYPTVNKLKDANVSDVEKILRPLGLSKVKAHNIVNCSKVIVEEFKGIIPNSHNDLLKLPGIGNKTANVFLAVYYNIPRFAVDTHVKRVSQRLCLTQSDDVKIIESDLMRYFEKNTWIKIHHQMIFFGRYFCTAKKPKCDKCFFKNNHCSKI